jgi:PIN domain nuclease of toxin-antitoxin system
MASELKVREPGLAGLRQRPLLLDTHALLRWLLDSPELSATARAAIADPAQRVLVSAASAWELATKQRIGKLPEAGDIVTNFSAYLRKQRFEPLPISVDHALAAGRLPGPHRDPFDRMLMAQAQTEGADVVTADPVFRDYGVAVVW